MDDSQAERLRHELEEIQTDNQLIEDQPESGEDSDELLLAGGEDISESLVVVGTTFEEEDSPSYALPVPRPPIKDI